MGERLTTLLSAVTALVIVVALLVPTAPPTTPVSLPTSIDAGRYGLLGLKRWLDYNHIANHSLQTRYDGLFADAQITDRGNLLILFTPTTVAARAQELDFLLYWLAQGNDALVLNAVSDVPPWAMTSGMSSSPDVLEQLGFRLLAVATENTQASGTTDATHENREFEQENVDATSVSMGDRLRALSAKFAMLERQEAALTPALHPYPLVKDINHLGVHLLPALQTPLELGGVDAARSALVVLHDTERRAALWETRVGAGRLWISRFADLFGNVTLGKQDNAAFLANLIAYSLQPGGQVIFDDMHFGVSSLYDPQAFFGDSRLHHTLWFILGFWLLYVVGHGSRFAPQLTPPPEVRGVDFSYAVGDYFARALDKRGAALALFQHFFNDVRAHGNMPLSGEPVWEELRQHPRVSMQSVTALQDMYQGLNRRKYCNLIKLRNQLLTVRRQIA